jgi:hypothetical protein
MSEIFDLCWIEKDKANDKKSYHRVGIVMVRDDGSISVRINTLPRMGVAWDGWLSAFRRDGSGSSGSTSDTLDAF